MKKADRTPEQKAVDRVITQAMAFHHCVKDSELPRGKGIMGKLLRSCARLKKLRKREM